MQGPAYGVRGPVRRSNPRTVVLEQPLHPLKSRPIPEKDGVTKGILITEACMLHRRICMKRGTTVPKTRLRQTHVGKMKATSTTDGMCVR